MRHPDHGSHRRRLRRPHVEGAGVPVGGEEEVVGCVARRRGGVKEGSGGCIRRVSVRADGQG